MREAEAIAVAVTGAEDAELAGVTLAALADCERAGPVHILMSGAAASFGAWQERRRAWRDAPGMMDGVTVEELPLPVQWPAAERRDRAIRQALTLAPMAIAIEAGETPQRDALRWFAFGRDALLRRGAADVIAAMSRTLGSPVDLMLGDGRVWKEADRAGLINQYLVGPWTPPGAFATDEAGWRRLRPALDAAPGIDPMGWPGLAAAHGVRCAWPVISRCRWFGPEARWRPLVASDESWLRAVSFAPAEDEREILQRVAAATEPQPPRMAGYDAVLAALHQRLRPELYVEIGVDRGRTLALASCRAIGVDPAPRVAADVLAARPNLEVVAETSDAFYARADLAGLLGRPVDLTFIDGLHLFDQVLRDFINAERWAAPGGAIVLHDVLPNNDLEAGATQRIGSWAGDVWRIVDCLAEHRPDLRCLLLASPPTGLLVVTGLDPANRVLRERYGEITGALSFDGGGEYLAALRRYQVTTATTALDGIPEDALPIR